MSRMHSEVPSSESIQHQAPIVNQAKQTSDPWNNSWNWDFDKQADNQQQQVSQQEHRQQQHFVPPYTNQGQLISNSIQDRYYQNVNGNNSDLLNQNSLSDNNIAGSGGDRQPVSNHSDSFVPYSNYAQYQQYPPPPPPITSSVKSEAINSQWINEQQTQNIPYTQQEPTVQAQKDQAAHSSLASNNYNWHKPDQANLMSQHNWQSNMPGQWQDPTVDTEAQNFDEMGNQRIPPLQPVKSNPALAASPENINKEHSINDANNWYNQNDIPTSKWNSQNRVPTLQGQNQQPAYNTSNEFNSWSQASNTDISQQWQHVDNLHTATWLQEQKEDNNVPEENFKHDNANVVAANNWQQNCTVLSHHPLPNAPPLTESSVEQEERRKSIPSLTTNPTVSKDSAAHAKTGIVTKSQVPDSRLNVSGTPETMSTVASSENISIQGSNDFNLANDPLEWGRNSSTDELPTKLEQLSLGAKLSKQSENQTEASEIPSASSADGWNQNAVSQDNVGPDNIPGLPSDYATVGAENSHSIDNQGILSKDHSVHNTYQMANIKSTDNIAQSGYDQWYNQNTLPRSSDNTWYSKDHARSTKEWNAGQNVENYENIQQPSEFVNLEVVTPSLQERDIYGSRDSINKETLDNDPKPVGNPVKEVAGARDFRQETNNIEVPSTQQLARSHQPSLQPEQV